MREQDLRALSCGRSPAPTGEPGPCRRAYKSYVSTHTDVEGTAQPCTTLPKEFNPNIGLYVVDKPGYYLIDVRPVGGTAQTPDGTTHVETWCAYEETSDAVMKWSTREFVYLVLETETNIEYVDVLREGGGLLRHLTKGTEISVQALDVPHAPARVCLRIEMAMRKRKCRASDEEEEADESKDEVKDGESKELQHKKKKGKHREDGTSSEEEWDQGFSSDTDDEKKVAERQQIRTITRAFRKHTVEEQKPLADNENEETDQEKKDKGKGKRGGGRGGRPRGGRRGRGRGRGRGAVDS